MIRRRSLVGALLVGWDRLVALATGERLDARCPVGMHRYDRDWACVRRYGHGGRPMDEQRIGSHVWQALPEDPEVAAETEYQP